MADHITATVRVTLQVEVTVGNWSPNESFASLREQATREANQALAGALRGEPMRVVGKPVAMHVTLSGEANHAD